ncbi:MAG: hypothetical protein ACLTSG_12530 [Lachnospiraceae bacterium]
MSVTVYAPEGAVLSINGVELDESYKTGDSVTLALFEGLESYGEAPAMEAWEIGGLHLTPEISAVDAASGAELSAPICRTAPTSSSPRPTRSLRARSATTRRNSARLLLRLCREQGREDRHELLQHPALHVRRYAPGDAPGIGVQLPPALRRRCGRQL